MSSFGQDLLEAAEEMLAFAKGEDTGAVVHVPEDVDVKAIRKAQQMTQEGFSEAYGFKLSAVRDWEQKRRTPERAARILLKVIEKEPDAVRRALTN